MAGQNRNGKESRNGKTQLKKLLDMFFFPGMSVGLMTHITYISPITHLCPKSFPSHNHSRRGPLGKTLLLEFCGRRLSTPRTGGWSFKPRA